MHNFIKYLVVIAIYAILLTACTSCNKNELKLDKHAQPINKTEFKDCMNAISGDWTDEDCEYVKFLLTYEVRTIKHQWQIEEGGHIYWNVDFADSTGLDFLTDYEMTQVSSHSLSPL